MANDVPAGILPDGIKILLLCANLSWTPIEEIQTSITFPYPFGWLAVPTTSASTVSEINSPAEQPISIPPCGFDLKDSKSPFLDVIVALA